MERTCGGAARKFQIPTPKFHRIFKYQAPKVFCQIATSRIVNLEVSLDVGGWNLEFEANGFTDSDRNSPGGAEGPVFGAGARSSGSGSAETHARTKTVLRIKSGRCVRSNDAARLERSSAV